MKKNPNNPVLVLDQSCVTGIFDTGLMANRKCSGESMQWKNALFSSNNVF